MIKVESRYIVITAVLTLAVVAALLLILGQTSATIRSVEFGLAELSPRGEAGGYAMPASGSSDPCASGGCSGNSLPTLTLWADQYVVKYGHGTNLHWSSENTNTCNASGGWSGTKGTSGSEPTGSLKQRTSYYMQCSGSGSGKSATSLAGGWGGSAFAIYCPSNGVITGLHGNSGRYTDSVGAYCTSGSTGVSPNWGGGSGYSLSCPSGYEAVGIHGRAGSYVDSIGLVCVNASGNTQNTGQSPSWGGGSSYELACPSGYRANGLYGHSGAWLDRIGVSCVASGDNYTDVKQVSVDIINGTGADITPCKSVVHKDEKFCVDWNIGTSEPQYCVIKTGEITIDGPLQQTSDRFEWSITGETTFTLDCEEGGNTDSATVKVLPEFQET